jgi:hypothetical protein
VEAVPLALAGEAPPPFLIASGRFPLRILSLPFAGSISCHSPARPESLPRLRKVARSVSVDAVSFRTPPHGESVPPRSVSGLAAPDASGLTCELVIECGVAIVDDEGRGSRRTRQKALFLGSFCRFFCRFPPRLGSFCRTSPRACDRLGRAGGVPHAQQDHAELRGEALGDNSGAEDRAPIGRLWLWH